MRIGLLHAYAWPEVRRGGERYLHGLASYLSGAGHDVDVITGSAGRSSKQVDDVTLRRLRHLPPGIGKRWGFSTTETFGAVALPSLARRRFDVVHAFTPSAAVASRLTGHRTVYTLLGLPTRDHFWPRTAERRITRVAVRLATEISALSEAAADATEDLFGRRPVVLAPGTWLDRFPPSLEPRTGPPRLFFSGAVEEQRKGLDATLQAFAAVLECYPSARLAVSGPGDPTWALDELGADRPRVEAATDFLGTGQLDDLPDLYRRSTVTVFPSRNEAFGLVVVESLATGTPVVCWDTGGPAEIVTSDEVGRKVGNGDVDGLATALLESIALAAKPNTPSRCVAHARSWGWAESVGAQHEVLYRGLAKAKRA